MRRLFIRSLLFVLSAYLVRSTSPALRAHDLHDAPNAGPRLRALEVNHLQVLVPSHERSNELEVQKKRKNHAEITGQVIQTEKIESMKTWRDIVAKGTPRVVLEEVNRKSKRKRWSRDDTIERMKQKTASSPGGFQSCSRIPHALHDRRGHKKELSIATLNTEFLFFKNMRLVPWGATLEEAAEYFHTTAQVIAGMQSDIVQLSEVEDCDALFILVDILEALDVHGYVPYILQGNDTFTGQNVAFLTKLDPFQVFRINERNGSTQLTKNLGLRFRVPLWKHPLTVLGAHLIAGGVQNRERRNEQAQLLWKVAEKYMALKNHVIVLGDFNAEPESNVLRSLTRWNASSMFPKKLFSVHRKILRNKRPIHTIAKDSKQTVDYILLSPELQAHCGEASVLYDLYEEPNKQYSDHYPVRAKLQT